VYYFHKVPVTLHRDLECGFYPDRYRLHWQNLQQ